MLPAQKIRNVFHLLGYDENTLGIRLFAFPILMSSLILAIFISTLLCITLNSKRHDDVTTNRIYLVMATKDINVVLTVLLFSLEYLFVTKNMKELLSVIDKKFIKFNNVFPKEQTDLFIQSRTAQMASLNMTAMLLCVCIGIFAILPGLVSAYMIYENSLTGTNIVDLPLPVVSWYPKKYETLYTYIIVYVCQAIFLINSLGLGYCMYASTIASFQTLVLEIKLFCSNVERIDIIANDNSNGNIDLYTANLRHYTRFLVRSHQEIIRCAKQVTRCIAGTITITNQDMCFQICAYLYCIAEVDNIFAKFAYLFLALSLMVIILVYCNNGQNIVNAGETLKQSLYRCSWLEKPKWFRKDLQIMLVMAEVPIQIKPFGLYVLDLRTFTTILNASYSYFNLIKTVKN